MEFIQLYDVNDPIKLEPELLACRVCLVTDVRLYCLHHKLAEYYEEVTGIHVSRSDGLPQHVCALCAALLRRAADVCARSRDAHHRLLDYVARRGKLTTDCLPLLCTTPSRKLTKTDTEIISIDGDSLNEFKQEDIFITTIPIFTQDDSIVNDVKVDLKIRDSDSDSDTFDHEDVIVPREITVENISTVKQNTKDITKIAKRKKTLDKTDDSIKKYCTENLSDNPQFYQYVLDKYVNRTIPIEGQSISIDEIKSINKIPTEFEEHKLEFYNYITDKYVHKKVVKKPLVKTKKTLIKQKTVKDFKIAAAYEKFAIENNCEVIQLETKEQKIAMVEKRKDLNRYKNSAFKCDICYTGFSFEQAFKKHMALHDESAGPHVCDVCHMRYATRRGLADHYTRHSVVITCKLCRLETNNTSMAKLHYNTHTGHEYKCEYCGKIFTRYKTRMEHMRRRHGSQQCEICYSYYTDSGYKQHLRLAHSEKITCGTCGMAFASPLARDTHAPTCGDGTPCARCGLSLPSSEAWRRHVAHAHSRQNMDREARKQYQHNAPQYKKAKREGTSENVPRRPGRPCTVTDEEDLPPISRDYMCEYCAKSFASASILQAHQRVHTGEKPYQCSLCPKTFRIKFSMQAHERTHTGDRPFNCSDCGKAFKTYTARNRHQNNVHKHMRRHRCHVCDKTFQTSSCVKAHVNSVHLKIPSKPRIRNRRPRASPLSED